MQAYVLDLLQKLVSMAHAWLESLKKCRHFGLRERTVLKDILAIQKILILKMQQDIYAIATMSIK